MLDIDFQGTLAAILIVPLGISAGAFPLVGNALYRKRFYFIFAFSLLALLGIVGRIGYQLDWPTTISFAAPLFQTFITCIAYRIWYKYNKRPPHFVTAFDWYITVWARLMTVCIIFLNIAIPSVPFAIWHRG